MNWAWSLPPTSATVTGVCAWPSMVKVTVPVGVPEYVGAVTVAVKVTCSPTDDGLTDDARVGVDVLRTGALTVCVGSEPLLPTTFESPL